MARADLSSMLGKLGDDGPQPLAEPSTTPRQKVAPRTGVKSARSEQKPIREPSEAIAPATGDEPLYLRLERKETRLRADQYAALTEHARRLNRAKGTGGERITENTLIRVAIDLLLSRIDQVAGTDEGQLRTSVTL